jgi:hypothetical protein
VGGSSTTPISATSAISPATVSASARAACARPRPRPPSPPRAPPPAPAPERQAQREGQHRAQQRRPLWRRPGAGSRLAAASGRRRLPAPGQRAQSTAQTAPGRSPHRQELRHQARPDMPAQPGGLALRQHHIPRRRAQSASPGSIRPQGGPRAPPVASRERPSRERSGSMAPRESLS